MFPYTSALTLNRVRSKHLHGNGELMDIFLYTHASKFVTAEQFVSVYNLVVNKFLNKGKAI